MTRSNLPPLLQNCILLLLLCTSAEAIVGGSYVNDTSDFPAFVWSGLSLSDGWGCGGALIHDDIVLSAGHCFVSWINNDNIYVDPLYIEGKGAEKHATDLLLLHPGYNWTSKVNDVMLIKLRDKSKVKPFKLNRDPDYPPVNSSVTTIGFGTTSEFGGQASFSPKLKQVSVDVYSYEQCKAIYDAQHFVFQINATQHICAGTVEGGRDGCESDSGTPLLDEHNLIVGLTQDGIGCARPNVPAYYVRISTHIDWIQDAICALSDVPPKHKCKQSRHHMVSIRNQTKTRTPTMAPTTVAPTTSKPTPQPTIVPPPTTRPPTLAPTTAAPTPVPTLFPTATWRRNHNHHRGNSGWFGWEFCLLLVSAVVVGFLMGRSITSWLCNCVQDALGLKGRNQYETIPSQKDDPSFEKHYEDSLHDLGQEQSEQLVEKGTERHDTYSD